MGAQPPPVRVLLVEDHEVVAQALVGLLDDQPDITSVGRVARAAGAVTSAVDADPDVILMDYHLPDGDGVTLTRELRTALPSARVVFLTAQGHDAVLIDALDAGATGFVTKNGSAAELIAAIRAAAEGESYFTPDVLAQLVSLRHGPTRAVGPELTAREREILQRCANGESPAETAEALHLSIHTVRNYLRRAMAKLDAHTRLEAVLQAVAAGLIELPR